MFAFVAGVGIVACSFAKWQKIPENKHLVIEKSLYFASWQSFVQYRFDNRFNYLMINAKGFQKEYVSFDFDLDDSNCKAQCPLPKYVTDLFL